MTILKVLKNEVYWGVLAKALISLLPAAIGYIMTGNVMFWNMGLVTISLGIGAERLNLGILAITFHFLLIFCCFTILFFAFVQPYLFVILCAMMAVGTIYFTRHGSQLRTLANFTFIPAVYLTCELHEKLALALTNSVYLKFISLMPIAWLSVIIIYGLPQLFNRSKNPALKLTARRKLLHKIFWGAELGNPEAIWVPPAIAIFFGVAIAASMVIFLHISRGEWVIWSVASVITIEFSSSKKKFNQRISGVLIGAPLGFFAAQFAPKIELMYVLAAVGIMLTLVAFKSYRMGFASRCFLVAFAAYIASSTPAIAVERIGNVLLGGLIGIIAIYVVEWMFNYFKKPDA